MARKKQNNSTIINIIVGVLGSLIICCTGIAAVYMLGAGATKTSAPASFPSPIPIETMIAGTVAAARSQTQAAAPLAIPTNTLIPAPIETQQAPASPSREAILSYYQTMDGYATEYIADMETMGALLQESDANSLLYDNTWKANISISLAEMQISGRRLGSMIDVPVELQQADFWFKKASAENELLIVNLNDGIQNIDASSIDRANENLDNVNLYFHNGMTEVTNVLSSLSNSSIEPTATIFISVLQTNAAQPADYVYSTNTPFTLVTFPAQTDTPIPLLFTATSSGGETAACSCSGGLDCKDFSTHNSAQACYNYCYSLGLGDVHGLDGNDHDGQACESLP